MDQSCSSWDSAYHPPKNFAGDKKLVFLAVGMDKEERMQGWPVRTVRLP
jgi:hypothetical protein